MTDSTRRTFFKVAGAGAAAAGATVVLSSAADAAAPEVATLPAGANGSLVAYIRDLSTGEVSVMIEGHEVTVIDHALTAKLARAIHDRFSAQAV